MNPLNKILIQVPASDPPKEDRYYYALVETLAASEVPALIKFSNGQWLDNSMCTVTHYYRPAESIEEIKEMLGQQLFTKDDMRENGRKQYYQGYDDAKSDIRQDYKDELL